MYRKLTLFLLLLVHVSAFGDIYRPPRARKTHRTGEQRKKIDIKEEMTPQQFRRSGLKRLSAQELKNLEVWLSRWRADEVEAEMSFTLVIEDIREGGNVLILNDGSNWKVSPFSVRLTRRWSTDHRIEVHPPKRLNDYYTLKNMSTRESIEAKLTTGPDELEESNVQKIDRIGYRGDTITLEDGSVWRVSTLDRLNIRDWKQGQRVEVQEEYSRERKKTLYNLDVKESLEATMERGPRKEKKEPSAKYEDELEEEEIEEEELEDEQNLHKNWRWWRDKSVHGEESTEE